MQVCGGEVPESRPGGQRLGPSALHERGTPALCWGAAEPQLNYSSAAAETFLQLSGQFVHLLNDVFRSVQAFTDVPSADRRHLSKYMTRAILQYD